MTEPQAEAIETTSAVRSSPFKAFDQHLCQTETTYAKLMNLKEKGWKNPKGDEHFENKRRNADTATPELAARFYHMMREIGDEMQAATGAFRQTNRSEDVVGILDLCMAPGGYTASALKYNPTAKAIGITLSPEKGSHEVLLLSSRSTVLYHDITMFVKEFGAEEIPTSHPGHDSFSLERPFLDQRFDLVICDGVVLRTHKRPEYREPTEANRLKSSQLILVLQRIRQGGTFIILLHKIETLDSIELLYRFSQFSNIEVFKPVKKHAENSSFYLIAKNVQPDSTSAIDSVTAWKKIWWNATFGGEQGVGAKTPDMDDEHEQEIIDSFGKRFIELARPIWKVQADSLSEKEYTK